MKFRSSLSCLAIALLLMARFSPAEAQAYNPPPPPEQQNTGGDQPMDQGAPQPGQAQPMPDDQGAPPPPGADMQDQGAPPPDEGAPTPDAGSPDASGGDANFQTFYNDLSSEGNWVQTQNYGYAWQPNVDDPNWRPYSDGHWVYTDEGWTWVADESEPWGWATYHYGRWVNIDGYGWMWVPGYTWAPAWVSWRYGDGYCGWAPLPPDTFVGIDFGGVGLDFHIGGDCDTAYGIGPGYYNFIPVGYLGERDYRGYYRNRNDNFALIANTRNVTNIYVSNRSGAHGFSRVSVGGPDIATVNAQSRTPVARLQLARSNSVGNARANGRQLAVYAPRVQAASGATFRPSRVSATIANARVNNGTSIARPLAVTSRLHSTAPSSAQIAAAQRTASRASTAHFATATTRPSEALSRPLTSYQPRTETSHAAIGTSAPAARTVTPAAVAQRSTEASFTGEDTAPRVVHHASASGAAGEPTYRHASEAAPQADTTERAAGVHASSYRDNAETPVRHAEAPAEPTHAEERPAEVHREAPAPAHAAEAHAAPARPSGGGGGGGHPGGGGKPADGKGQDDQRH